MSLQLSTQLRNGMLNATGFTEAFANGVMYIYSGPQPVNADAAVQGTLCGIVTKAAGAFAFGVATNGLNFLAPALGVINKDANAWQMVGLVTDTAGWFRLMGNPADNLAGSLILPRLDGSVSAGGGGGDLLLSSVNIVAGAPTTIDVFTFTLPAF
jgi:hypothetical protein